MRAVQKLVRNGNSTAVSIPRPFLFQLRWLPGCAVIVELTEDCKALVIREPQASDFGMTGAPRILPEPATVKG